jgi:hypothetical protein
VTGASFYASQASGTVVFIYMDRFVSGFLLAVDVAREP